LKHSEIRKHYFLDRYVIIAPKRSARPRKMVKVDNYSPDGCSFCAPQVNDPKLHKTTFELKSEKDPKQWSVKSIVNDFSALTLDNIKAYGYQEVILETPDHGVELYELSIKQIVAIIDVYINRYLYAKSIEGIKYTILFKNEGGKAGSSVDHSHSQMIALPILPPKLESEAAAMDIYTAKHGTCPYCDIIKSEKGTKRVIFEDDHLFVLAPYASENPYTAWFIPKRHVHSIDMLHENEKESIAHALKKMLRRLDEVDVSYNYFFQNSLDCEAHHMVLKLDPRPNVWAGLELGTGVIINPIPPEDVPTFYNQTPDSETKEKFEKNAH
jgi:UDPglucose--hexose-1-phosphate uridylyltransferase